MRLGRLRVPVHLALASALGKSTLFGGVAVGKGEHLGRFDDLLLSEPLEERLPDQHRLRVTLMTTHHGVLVGETIVEREAKPGKELGRLRRILHRQVDERRHPHRDLPVGARRLRCRPATTAILIGQ